MMRKNIGLLFVFVLVFSLAIPSFALGDTSNTGEESGLKASEPSSSVIVDPDTRERWKNWESDTSTRDVGHVWTDKTVRAAGKGSTSDFLTTFSAVSSSLNGNLPTKVVGGDASRSGYVTFTDELGEFMQVDGFTEVAIGGVSYGPARKSTSENVDTYAFSGEVAGLIITVERASEDNPGQGDMVTVKIPASLIPTRAYSADAATGVFSVDPLDDVSPICVTYASSVKDIARQNLFTPANVAGLTDYIEGHRNISADVTTGYFLANKWSGSELGNTNAEFEPASTNGYYFFQENTPIYTDKECTRRATTKPEGGKTYYYKDEFVTKDASGKAVSDSAIVAFEGEEVADSEGTIYPGDGGCWCFAKGASRLGLIGQLDTEKSEVGENKTETAEDALSLQWGSTNNAESAACVQAHLGNNGKIAFSFDVTPVALDSKESFGLTTMLEGRDWLDDDAFTFDIVLDGSESGDPSGVSKKRDSTTVTRDDADENGIAKIGFGDIAFTNDGTYVYKIYEQRGAAGGIAYSENVAEVTVKVAPDAAGVLHATVSPIVNPLFKNTYRALPLETEIDFGITKQLVGRDWADDECFDFEIGAAADSPENTPLPTQTQVSVWGRDASGDKAPVRFGKIRFTEAGTYKYDIREVAGSESGIDYDEHVAKATVVVTDDGKGRLAASVTYPKNDESVDAALFVNKYNDTQESGASGSDDERSISASTGDSSMAALLAAMTFVLAVATCLAARRRLRS